jgi:hypothetical protein
MKIQIVFTCLLTFDFFAICTPFSLAVSVKSEINPARQRRNQNLNHEIHQTHERGNCPRPLSRPQGDGFMPRKGAEVAKSVEPLIFTTFRFIPRMKRCRGFMEEENGGSRKGWRFSRQRFLCALRVFGASG